jgi:hypothetical protein
MEWLRVHPYISAIVAVVVLIIAGGYLVASRAPVAPSGNSLTWEGGTPVAAYQQDETAAQSQTPQQIAQEVIGSQAPATLSLSLAPVSAAASSSFHPTSGSFDYEQLLAQLSTPPAATPASGGNSANQAIAEAYQFIPTGLVATSAPAKKPMAADQQALYGYGNEIGAEIQSFEALHPDEAEVLKDQAEDRTDPTKNAAVVSLGQGLASIGTYMQGMQDVPSDVTSQHNALAQSYLDIGAKLQLIPQAQSDAGFVQAVENYDTAANTFVKNYGAMAQYFSEQGVVFSPQDPGSVFSFTDASGSGGL